MKRFEGTLILETDDYERNKVVVTEVHCRYDGEHPDLTDHPRSWEPVTMAARVLGIDALGGIWLLKDRHHARGHRGYPNNLLPLPQRIATAIGYDS